jgi:sulfite exporter TauE/SafE
VIADVAGKTFGVGLLLSAFFFGFRHGIDWDHIAAITDITGSQDDRRSGMIFGTIYALGHAFVVFLIGTGAILLGERLPRTVDSVMERIVGATLIVLGVYVFVALIRHGREFRLRSRWMLIFSGGRKLYRRVRGGSDRGVDGEADDDHDRQPVHSHAQGSADALSIGVVEDIPISDWHHGHHGRPGHHHHKHPEPDPDDPFMNYQRHTAFIVGMIHGVGAETPTQLVIFLTLAGAGTRLAGEAGLAAFLLGLLCSNTLITFGSATGFIRASSNWKIYVTVALLTAVFSLVIGTLFLFGRGTLLPALFGG